MDMNRRAVVKSAALGAAVAAPKLANAFECSPAEIDPETGTCPVPKNDVDKPKVTLAPMIQIMDHRGCTRPKKEYKGKASGDGNDDMCVCVCACVPSPSLSSPRSCDPGSAPRDMTAVWAGSHDASLRLLPSPRRIAASAPIATPSRRGTRSALRCARGL